MIIDATDLILGRMATVVAKKALLGEEIHIVNSENAVLTGRPKEILESYNQTRRRGIPLRGPYFPRMPHMIVKRTIRGMLPYKKPKGREALERIKCHIGVPESLSKEKAETIESANVKKTDAKFIYIKEISKQLGAKIE